MKRSLLLPPAGSDLKNLCVAAAHRPIREFLAAEKAAKECGGAAPPATLRPLALEDFKACLTQVRAVTLPMF